MQPIPITASVLALGFAALAALCLRHSERRPQVWALSAACLATAAWALDLAITLSAQGTAGGLRGTALDLLSTFSWFLFLVLAFRDASGSRQYDRAFAASAALAALVAILTTVAAMFRPPASEQIALAVFEPYGHMALTIAGLVLLEPLLRHARVGRGGRMPTLVIGVGGLLAYELFVWSEALLFRRLDPTLVEAQVLIHLLALPLIGAGVARNHVLSMDLKLARKAVVDSATLTAIGAYLLALAGVGALLQQSAGEWGRLLQLGILFTGGLALALAWFSPWLRARVRFQLGRYLFTHRQDYRAQWQSFSEALSAPRAALYDEGLQVLANVLGARRAGLWLRDDDGFTLRASRSLPAGAEKEALDARFVGWLERCGPAPRLAGEAAPDLPAWLRGSGDAWVVVPLVRRDLVGVVLLGGRGGPTLHREDTELLEIGARHVTSALLADERARRSAEARRFEELSRGMSFIAHDLRNVANELTLTLANARKHIANPEFQRDLLISMEDSVASMQRLLDKVAQRRAEATRDRDEPTDLGEAARSAVRKREGSETKIELRVPRGNWLAACDFDRAASACGHLVQNALDAAGPGGHVRVSLERQAGDALLRVCDDGPGMDERELADRLRHPFQSSKTGGFGIGLFECREFARELSGELSFETAPGAGTTATLRLPLIAPAPEDSEEDDVDQ